MAPAHNTRSVARAARAESFKIKKAKDKHREIVALFRRIRELYPTAARIAITTSAIAQGVHLKWTYDPESDTSTAIERRGSVSSSVASSYQLESEGSVTSTDSSDTSYAPSTSTRSRSSSLCSLLSLSSLSSIDDDDDDDDDDDGFSQPDAIADPTFTTPRQRGPGTPGTALRTPRKAFPGHALRRGRAPHIDWNAEHSPEQPRLRRNQAQPLGEAPTLLNAYPKQEHNLVRHDNVLEEEERRRQEVHATRTFRQEMAILEAQSQAQQHALQVARETGAFDEDDDGNDVNDMEVDQPLSFLSNHSEDPRDVLSFSSLPAVLTTQMTSDVLLELPGSYPRQANARFYRDPTGRWQLEGSLETELLTEICSNHKEMTQSAFRLNCQEWQHLQSRTEGPAMARVRAPLTEEDVKAMQAEAALLAAQNRPPVRQYTETQFQPMPPGMTEPQAGPSGLTREDTEVLDIDVSVQTMSSQPRSFPGGRRIQ